MRIENLFFKPIRRSIKGVVVVDQRDAKTVWQELDEYVVTRELRQHYDHFFKAYLSALDHASDPAAASRMGVWVSGFFGSGKSHFIKMLSYLLKNDQVTNPETAASKKPIEFFNEKLSDALFGGEIRRAVNAEADVILFNIDSKADSQKGSEAMLDVFFRVFNEMQGFSPDLPHVAELERYLTERGVYEQFKEAFELAGGGRWQDERDTFYFKRDEIITALTTSLNISHEAAAQHVDNADRSVNISVDNFARKVKDYLDRQPANKRLVFIVDEVGQFIGGDTQLMLKLQTIVEDLGTLCRGRAWIIVTSQEDVEAVLGEMRNRQINDFSKIQGRFQTRLKLSSVNTDEVIQERLLKKTAQAEETLIGLFEEKGEILRHQIVFSGGTTLAGFRDETDFVRSYPFLPYQFQLVQKIFESIRKFGATGAHLSQGERSMLEAFQMAAVASAEKETGALVPLYEFYPAIEGFLESAVKRLIEQSADNTALEPVDGKVLRMLFLLRYVETFKTNVENLVTLFIDEVDADRAAIRRELEGALQRLESQSLINRNGDEYQFLTDEERRVSAEIKSLEISDSEENRKIAEILFDEILRDAGKYRYQPNKRDYGFNLYCDGIPYKRIENELDLRIITPHNQDYQFYNEARLVGQSSEHSETGGCILIKLRELTDLPKSKSFLAELRSLLQTQKYADTRDTVAAPPTLKQIINDRRRENDRRKIRLKEMLEQMLKESDFYALGQKLSVKPTSGARQMVAEAQNYLIENVFSKLNYLPVESRDWEKEIRNVLLVDDVLQNQLVQIEDTHATAAHSLREYIKLQTNNNQRIGLDTLVERFTRRPYGWLDYAVVWLIAKLFVAGELNLLLDNDLLTREKAVEPLTRRNRWKSVSIRQRQTTDVATINAVRNLAHEIFTVLPADKEDLLQEFWHERLKIWQTNLQSWLTLAETGSYVGKKEIGEALSQIIFLLAISDSFEFFKALREKADSLRDLKEDFEELENFYTSQRPAWERLKAALSGFIKQNRSQLEKDETVRLAVARLDEISLNSRPFAFLHETGNLLSITEVYNDNLISGEKQQALAQIENHLYKLIAALDELKADGSFRNQTLMPIQQLKKRIENGTSYNDIHYEWKIALPPVIETAEEKIEEARIAANSKNAPPPKPTFVLRPAQITNKTYLENAADTEEFLDKLRETILKILAEEKRVKIQ